jgi:iron-sulfur cluster assembly accessory protein
MATIEQDLIRLQPAVPQPMILISEAASSRLLAMMREKELEGFSLRVFVSGGGCSGLQYGMTFDDEMREDDNEFQAGALRVVIDPISAGYMTGASIDYIESIMGSGFKIENPNAVSSCGCGHSFRTADQGDDAATDGCGTCGA